MPQAGAKLGEEANMKTFTNFFKLFALLSASSFAQSTQKYDQYLSRAPGTPTLLRSQAATSAGSGGSVSLIGGNAFGAGNVGGDAIISGGTGGAGASKGKLLLNTLLKFNTAPDAENGHIRNDSNTPIFVVNQSTASAFTGAFSGNFTYSGLNNTGYGHSTLSSLTSGASNTAIGSQAMGVGTDGSNNVAVGRLAIGNSSSGNENVAAGSEAMRDATNAASGNVAIGYQAGKTVDNVENTLVGYSAGTDVNPLTTGASNTFLGARAGLASATQHSFMSTVGANAKGECDNCVILGRTTDFTGIGLVNPTSALQVAGEFRLGSAANYVGFNVAAPTSYSVTLPGTAPTTGQVLSATSATTLAWAAPATNIGKVGLAPIALTADDQVVTITTLDIQGLTSNDATPANRTFTLNAPVNGQVVTFIWVGTDAAELLDDSAIGGAGNLRLNGDWLPQQYDTITIRCANSSGALDCYEVSRSDNN